MAKAADVFADGWAAGWAPEPRLSVSEWADGHRQLSGVSSPEAGGYRTDRTPYVREIADCLSATSPVRRIVFQGAAQIGKTEIGNNWLGYIIHHAPSPTLIVYPTVDVARRISKQRIDPMIAATPALRERIRDARARDSGNTVLMKEFDGGLVILTGANSGSGLRSMPIRNAFLDELDAWPQEIPDEGDPATIVSARQTNFANRKTYLCSTPTLKGRSRIEAAFLKTDQRRFFLPCPHCSHFDWIRWENIRWEEGDPSSARLMCVACGVLTEERYKGWMLSRGEWRPTVVTNDPLTRGYHLSAFYSPLGWKSWAECVTEFLASKSDTVAFRAWWNLVKAETWEERGLGATADTILERREEYFEVETEAEVPDGVGILVGSVDVQGDRLEAQVKGFGVAEESWLIAFSQFHGDPAREEVWLELDKFLRRKFRHASGRLLPLECVTIDSGGHHSEQVYKFCKARLERRVFAVRGGNEPGKPLVPRPTVNNRYRAKLFTLCVDTGKEMVYSRLAIGEPGPGYMHLPLWVDREYVEQLTAEKGVWKYFPGRGSRRTWVKTRARNEALDLEVYALAALHILGPTVVRSLPERAKELSEPLEPETPPAADARALGRGGRRGGGWMNSWRR